MAGALVNAAAAANTGEHAVIIGREVSQLVHKPLAEPLHLAVAVVADTTKTDVWIEDCSIASIIIQLAAEDLGLGSCWVQIRRRMDAEGNVSEDVVRKLLGIPEHYAVQSIVAIGHKAREAKPFDEEKMQWDKVHIGKFGGEE